MFLALLCRIDYHIVSCGRHHLVRNTAGGPYSGSSLASGSSLVHSDVY